MSQEAIRRPVPRTSIRTGGVFRLTAVLVLAAAVAVILFLVLRNSSSSTNHASGATKVTAAQIESLAVSVGHPVFWLGSKPGLTMELTRLANGTIYVRYLPAAATLGSNTPYLTVATYPFPGAYQALKAVSKQKGSTPINVADGGVAVVSSTSPENVHVAYPGVDFQVEIFDPTPGTATAIVAAGQLKAVGSLKSSTASTATAATVAGLKSAAKTLGHPIYWLGPKQGLKYELTQPSNGSVYVRYLPAAVAVGSSQPYLTVATYPYPGAFAALQALSKQKGTKTLKLAGGGIAIINSSDTKSAHLAFPGSNYEIEVFDPSPAVVRHLVSSGQVKSIG